MKLKKNRKLIAGLTAAGIVAVICAAALWPDSDREVNAVPKEAAASYEESYREYLEEHEYAGSLSDGEVTVDLEKFTVSADMVANIGEQGILTEDNGTITWEFQVAQTGFYNVELGYIALPGTTSDIQRKVYIDGEVPYEAMSQIVLKRWWQDGDIRVKNENEIRPEAAEIYWETKWFLEDYQRRNNEPLVVWLEKGKHTIGFEVIKEPLEYTSITFKAAAQPESYEQSIQELKSRYPVYSGENIICQAERREDATVGIIKSSSSINIQKNYSDSELQPYHPYHIIYNTVGAENWAQPGDSVTWQVEVGEEGLYELSFKGRQNLNRGVTSYRRLYINGEVPYEELQAIGFEYRNGMNHYTVADQEGNAYLFHLQAGVNTITLENVMGPMGSIITQVEESMAVLNGMYLDVIQLTGQVPNRFIDYEIVKKLPEFAGTMKEESERLYDIVEKIVAITGEKGENTAMLEKMALEASWLADDPESVIMELGQFKNNVSALGTWLVNVASMPLELDYLTLSSEGAELPEAQDSFWAGLGNGTVRFFSTFFIKNSQITEDSAENTSGSLKVWLASYGREQAQMIQNMIEEEFTPETDISVNLQLIPVDVVLRAALAGNGPDVVIGLGQTTLQDFAMRNAIKELSCLDGYEEATARFYESSLEASAFQGGYYGIPEQTTFMMLFTRDDILEDLGLKVPETWTELREMIPELQKNNYNVYIPNVQQTEASMSSSSIAYNMNLYLGMVIQNGGTPYLGEGEDYGIRSGLAEDAAMLAFKDYTDFFTGYGLDVQVDFSNRFRTGEIPVGITGYTTFNQLEIFAPEIKGLWSFHPIPGVRQEDGSIDRAFAVDTVQSVIMAKTRDLDASWEFLKWWTSSETQLQFANSLEALMGTSARYAAADPEVLKQLPWSNAELESLLVQFDESVGIQAVPGNYMTTRMVQYSFNDVVSENANPRETLYLNIRDIDQELTRKRGELHLSVAE